jgi:CRP/FNR family cyclic AMP-dependent transcriptional regulator
MMIAVTAPDGQTGSLDLLRAVPSFRGLSDGDLGRIDALLGERSVATGEVVIEEGASGQQSFLVLEGVASVITGGVTVAKVGPGEFVGELALLNDAPRCATVRADTGMRLLVLDKATLTSLLDPITEALLGTLARRLFRDTDAAKRASANDAGPSPWTVGAAVAVRSRYAGSWVEGFEIAEVDLTTTPPRFQLRRRFDGAVLPVFFDTGELRLV